jgi:tetratricopeptide (TPR) repeat protein
LILLLLLGGVVYSAYQARRAERRFQQVRKLANTFLFDFDGKFQNITGTTEARELLVKTALEYLDNLAQEAGGDSDLKYELAMAYGKVGDVQGNPRQNNLGKTTEALASYHKAMALAQSLSARDSRNPKYQRLLADLHFKLGYVRYQTGEYTEELAAHQRAVSIIEPLAVEANAAEEDLLRLISGYRSMANVEVEWVPAVAAGIGHYRQAMEIAERRARAFPSDSAQYQLAVIHSELGYALMQVGDPQTSLRESEAALALFEPMARRYPNEARYQHSLFITYQHLGMAEGQPLGVNLNDTAAALQTFARMQSIAQRLVDADPKD